MILIIVHEFLIFVCKLNPRLGSNKITSKGAIKLFRYLQIKPNTIEKLSLAGNRLDDKCMFDLGLLIESNTVLTDIELGFSEFGNDISDDGLKTLSPYLEKNKTLRKVSVSFNKRISDKCLPFIIKALESTQIEEFDVRGTSIVAKNSFFPILLRNSLVNGNRNFEWTWRKLQDDDLIAGCEHLQNFGQDVYNIMFVFVFSILHSLSANNCVVYIIMKSQQYQLFPFSRRFNHVIH